MNVKLISVTPDAEKQIAYCARVSNPNNQNSDSISKLLKYCIDHKHWSIFEMATLNLEINTTRGLAAQILRHRSFTFQEFCMSGDTNVYFDLPNAIKKGKRQKYTLTLEHLYKNWTKSNFHRNKISNMKVRIFDKETNSLTHSNIKEVFQTGIKDLFEITLENGKIIKSTKEHKVLTKNGFISLENAIGLNLINNTAVMSKNTFIGCNGVLLHQDYNWLIDAKTRNINNGKGVSGIAEDAGNKMTVNWSKVKKVKYLGKQMTYDLEINHDSHNYVANGVIVHNSQRYADTTLLAEEIPLFELRRQDTKNRQNSTNDIEQEIVFKWNSKLREHFAKTKAIYDGMIKDGIAKECARFVLPLATPTRLYMNGSLRSWITYIALREKNGTQKEHMIIAKECKKIFCEQFPIISEALGGFNQEWIV
jgi:thymidylate synthase ThyX